METAIKIDTFGGLQPRLDETALGDTQATVARNCRLHTTKLNAIRMARSVTDMPFVLENGLKDIGDAKTIAVWTRGDGYRDVIAWPGIVHVAQSNINADDRFRIFVTGETGVSDAHGDNQPCAFVSSRSGPVYGTNGAVIGHSVPKTFCRHPLYKETPPIATIKYYKSAQQTSVDAVELDPSTIRHTYFFQTFVDEYGYESGMSDVAKDEDGNMVEFDYNNNQKVSWFGVSASVVPSWAVKRYLYMVVTGSEDGRVSFVCEQNVGTGGGFESKFPININDQDTAESYSEITPIPTDLDWMTQMPGNFYVGFRRSDPRQICFSDVSIPTSWPDAYRYTIRDFAMGVAVAGNTAFVLTRGYPWAISGTAPEGMTAAQIVSEQACVSSRSICPFEGKVYYASQDGVCVLAEDSLTSTVVTRAYWDKASWSALNPSSCIMMAYDNALFMWFTRTDGTRASYIMDFDLGGNPIITETDDHANAAFVDVETDKLYFVGV